MIGQPEALRLADQLVDPVNAKLYLAPYVAAELRRQHALIEELREALRGLEPYLDAIVCYASTMDEYEPNRLAARAQAAIAKAEEQQ